MGRRGTLRSNQEIKIVGSPTEKRPLNVYTIRTHCATALADDFTILYKNEKTPDR